MTTLLHHWPLDENSGTAVADVVSANNGTISTLNGSDMYWTTGTGSGYAVGCNGQTGNDYDYISTATQVPAGGVGAYRIAVTFKQAAEYPGIFVQMETDQTGTGSTSSGNCLGIRTAGTETRVFITNTGAAIRDYAVNVADGEWHVLEGGSDASGNLELWLDGVSVGTPTQDSLYAEAGYWRMFGTKILATITANLSINAIIDDVKIYLVADEARRGKQYVFSGGLA